MQSVAPWIILSMFLGYIWSATVVVVHDEQSLATALADAGEEANGDKTCPLKEIPSCDKSSRWKCQP